MTYRQGGNVIEIELTGKAATAKLR
ncbi:hypothetical protein CCACVL1_12642 [Corchorus capsularis]|uniref:Uncharacterized protein n=1 Tax=Corchorus capsularis TaxID=210143 RepID=A0A1R3IEV5_COCAP|nr:hypothetical protein CCACVL1_12642 [Corchorus capsularis]